MVCKMFFCSEFPDIPEKPYGGKRRSEKTANAMCLAFQGNTIRRRSKAIVKSFAI